MVVTDDDLTRLPRYQMNNPIFVIGAVMMMTRMVMLMIRKDQHGKKNIGSMISPASLVASGSDWNKFFGFFSRLEFFGEDVHRLEILCIPYTMGGSQLSFLFCPSFLAELQ